MSALRMVIVKFGNVFFPSARSTRAIKWKRNLAAVVSSAESFESEMIGAYATSLSNKRENATANICLVICTSFDVIVMCVMNALNEMVSRTSTKWEKERKKERKTIVFWKTEYVAVFLVGCSPFIRWHMFFFSSAQFLLFLWLELLLYVVCSHRLGYYHFKSFQNFVLISFVHLESFRKCA